MSYDPQRPAREITPWATFELRRSHLTTGIVRVPYADEVSTAAVLASVARPAALTVVEHVPGADVPDVLDMLGIAEYAHRRADA